MKKVYYLLCLLFIFLSCTTNYGEKYGYRRHTFDCDNAIRLTGNDEIPQIEYVVFVGGFDSIALKLKNREPKEFRVQSNYYKKDNEIITFYKIQDDYDFPEFSFISKENVEYAYFGSEEINTVYEIGNGEALLFKIKESAFLYPVDVKKKKEENDNYKKYNNKQYKENSYFQ